MTAAAWLRPAIRLFSSSKGPASASPTHHLRRLLHQFSRAPSPSPSASSWSGLQSSALITRFSPLHGPARSYRSGSGRNRPATAKRHLYVVLGNHCEYGFDIHKLDMDDDADTGTLLRRLPEPPAVRVGTGNWMQFAALASSIIATGYYPRPDFRGVTAIYDTKTAELVTSDLLPSELLHGDGCDRVVAVGNRLYAFESCTDKSFKCCACEVVFPGGLHCLRASADGHPEAAEEDDDYKRWKWRPLPNSPHFSWSWNDTPPELPFDAKSISSYAVHPSGRTLFVSAGGWRVDVGTFTYGTGSSKWKRRGYWELPFKGPGHYDADLDAWVGLHRVEPDHETLEDLKWETIKTTDGHLCACCVTSAANASRRQPEWKVSKETLFPEDPPGWTRLEARLVYLGGRGEYCLVEHLAVNETTYVLRLTMFRAEYGEDGELIVTAHRPARSYEVPGYDDRFDTQAFWM